VALTGPALTGGAVLWHTRRRAMAMAVVRAPRSTRLLPNGGPMTTTALAFGRLLHATRLRIAA
jgi:hypothetical protein